MEGSPLSSIEVSQDDIQKIADARFIEEVRFSYVDIVEPNLPGFGQLSNLNVFVSDNSNLTDESLLELKSCRSLVEFDVSFSDVKGTGLSYLRDCKNLRVIRVCGSATDDIAIHLSEFKNLEVLDISYSYVSSKTSTQASTLPRLHFLGLAETQVDDEGLEWIFREDHTIAVLITTGLSLEDETIDSLRQHRSLERVSLPDGSVMYPR